MKDNLDQLVESYFAPKEEKLDTDALLGLIEEALSTPTPARIDEEDISKGKKFVISLQRLAPSEAWGDPEHMERKQIDQVFSVVRGGSSIPKRIQFLNDYLDPKKAARKTSPRVIINSMLIIEALKGALNHFNESSAGFVFESFMAALTGGHQQAGRVGGTLPIEDFVAFSQFGGESVPVSLKLLGFKTTIKGSFTNLVDYLFERGEPAIKYLIAYKTKEEGGDVGKLSIYDFDITRENLVTFLISSSKMSRMALGDVPPEEIEAAIKSGDKSEIARVFVRTPGYTKAGMLNQIVQGELSHAQAADVLGGDISESRQTFHEAEKAAMAEETALLTEGAAGDTQWGISKKQMETLGSSINLTHHGDLDFSSVRIDSAAEIYAKKLGDTILELLEAVQSLTNNIGGYFSERLRKNAMPKGTAAIDNAETIESNLKEQVAGDDSE